VFIGTTFTIQNPLLEGMKNFPGMQAAVPEFRNDTLFSFFWGFISQRLTTTLLLVLLLCVSINYNIYTYNADILPEWHHILRFFCYNTPKIISNQNSKLKFLRNTLKRKLSCSNYLLNIAIQRSLSIRWTTHPFISHSHYLALRSPRQSCQRLREILPPILILH
jgi:hypothetical protein